MRKLEIYPNLVYFAVVKRLYLQKKKKKIVTYQVVSKNILCYFMAKISWFNIVLIWCIQNIPQECEIYKIFFLSSIQHFFRCT